MAMFGEDDRTLAKRVHEIGQDLSELSLGEIDERIALLRVEIERLTQMRAKKDASRSAADAIFGKKA